MNVKQMQIAVAIIQGRDTAKALTGEEYGERVKQWKELLADVTETGKGDVLEALAGMLKTVAENPAGYGPTTPMWLCAAAFELICQGGRDEVKP